MVAARTMARTFSGWNEWAQWVFSQYIARWRFLDNLWLRRIFGDASKIPADSLEGYRRPVLENHGLQHGHRIVSTWREDLAELEKALSKIRNYPTLLMWGTKDRAVSFSFREDPLSKLPRLRLVAFSGVGHCHMRKRRRNSTVR